MNVQTRNPATGRLSLPIPRHVTSTRHVACLTVLFILSACGGEGSRATVGANSNGGFAGSSEAGAGGIADIVGGADAVDQGGSAPERKWPVGVGPVQPMTCEWIQGDNCWKRFVASAARCNPGNQPYTFRNDVGGGFECTFGDKSKFDGSRITRPDGSVCVDWYADRIGRILYTTGEDAVSFEYGSLGSFVLTCSDGSQWSNSMDGVCEGFGLLWLNKQAPGSASKCIQPNDGPQVCSWEMYGGTSGLVPQVLAACTAP